MLSGRGAMPTGILPEPEEKCQTSCGRGWGDGVSVGNGKDARLAWYLVALLLPAAESPAAPPPLPRLPFDARRAADLRAEWARAFGLQPAFSNGLGMKLVLIPGGRFDLGPNGSKHRVTLSRPYYLGVAEVTLRKHIPSAAQRKAIAADQHDTPVDVTSAPNTATQTHLGVPDSVKL
jgi:hypothetical protein